MSTNYTPVRVALSKKFLLSNSIKLEPVAFLSLECDILKKWRRYSRPRLLDYSKAIMLELGCDITTAVNSFCDRLNSVQGEFKISNLDHLILMFGENSPIVKRKEEMNKQYATCSFKKFLGDRIDIEEARAEFKLKYGSNSIESIIRRHGVTEEAAREIVKRRSERGLATYNAKPAEERAKIDMSKGLTLDNYVAKYGVELGTLKYEAKLKLRYKMGSRDWYIAKYGVEEGHRLYSIRTSPEKIYARPEWWMKRYNLTYDEAATRCKIALENRISFSKEYCIEKYGKELGLVVFTDRQVIWQQTINTKSKEELDRINAAKAVTLDTYIARYGEDEGQRKYVEMVTARWEAIQMSFSSGRSRIACKFFYSLIKSLARAGYKIDRRDLYVGLRGSKEFYLAEGGRVKFYDFTLRSIGVIIEFNGVFWHPRRRDEWSRRNVDFDDAMAAEVSKRDLAIKNGFDVFYVWDDDDLPEKIRELTNIITERFRKPI